MIKEEIEALFIRDIKKLQQEIASYNDEVMLWKITGGIHNAAGNLCLHLVGNLNTYVGAILGNTGYIRNRELEFTLKHVPKATLLQDLEGLIVMIKETFGKLHDFQLQENYPIEVLGYPITKLYFLMHLLAHVNYHLGQINYHRRIVTNIAHDLTAPVKI